MTGQLELLSYCYRVLIAFNKPYGVISQFTLESPGQRTLAEFGFPKAVYPIGRLDADSEGLLLLSDEADLNQRLLHPRQAHEREYWAQVERIPTPESLARLAGGVTIQGYMTLPCRAWLLDPQPLIAATPQVMVGGVGREEGTHLQASPAPLLPPRDPPIRYRRHVPDCWIGLALVEGKNRQVRRMTAAIEHPTLRLIRVRIGGLALRDLRAGQWRLLGERERQDIERRQD